jgi:cell division septum initiation protein DivIVA
MTILKKDLRAVQKDIKALEKKLEKLIKAFGTGKKVKAKPAAKKTTAKKTTAKKTIAKKAAPKKKRVPVKKAAVKKKRLKLTATDKVLGIIRRSKKGVNVSTIKTRTGFDDKKVRNIIFRTTKEGKIKKVGRGVYVGA